MLFTPTFDEKLKFDRPVIDAATKLGYTDARDVWDSLTGRSDWPETDLGEAAWYTTPEKYETLLRRASGVPMVVFLETLAEIVSKSDPDYRDDIDLRGYCVEAWKAFEEIAATAEELCAGYGWDLSKGWEISRNLCGENSHEALSYVKEIARLAGSMYNVMRGTRRRVPDGAPQEVKAITIGGDLERMLPSEHAQVSSANAALSAIAQMRVLQKKALQLQVAGDKPAGRGPVCICMDESGSMADGIHSYYDNGQKRNTWSKACMVALTRIAHEENRMVHAVHFDTSMVTRQLAPGDAQAVIDATLHFLGGGTDIGSAIEASRHEVKRMARLGHTGADVVLITDGCDGNEGAHNTAIDKLDKMQTKVWSVGIGDQIDEDHPLRKRAAKYIFVNPSQGDLAADAAKDLSEAAMGDKLR